MSSQTSSTSTSSELSFEVPPLETAKDFYEKNENSKQALAAMAIGLYNESGEPILDLSSLTNLNPKVKKTFGKIMPTKNTLIEEKKRRMIASGKMREKTFSTGDRQKFLDWLEGNPITNAMDIDFIQEEVTCLWNLILQANQATAENNDDEKAEQWKGIHPHLRLFHAIFDFDDIRAEFAKSFSSLTRSELDGRHNSTTARPNVWELISTKWNDPNFNPSMNDYYLSHDLFDPQEPLDLSYSTVQGMGTLTPSKAYEKYRKSASQLALVKSKHEQSGMGTGARGIHDSDEVDEDGDFVVGGGNDRSNFLDKFSPAILYLWEIAEEHELLKSVLQKIDVEHHLDDGVSPEIVAEKKEKSKKKKDTDREFMKEMFVSVKDTNMALFAHNVETMKGAQRDLKRELELAEDHLDDAEEEGNERKVERKKRRVAELRVMLDEHTTHMNSYIQNYQT